MIAFLLPKPNKARVFKAEGKLSHISFMRKGEKFFVPKVKFFCALILSERELFDKVLKDLERRFGEVDEVSSFYPFNFTDYYEQEMGKNLERVFVSFRKLHLPDFLKKMKLESLEVERIFSVNGKRKVNVDPGFLDYFKVVLASVKFGGWKIYLGDGVWADMVLWYEKGKFVPFSWTFPDFASGVYSNFLLKIRSIYKVQVKQEGEGVFLKNR